MSRSFAARLFLVLGLAGLAGLGGWYAFSDKGAAPIVEEAREAGALLEGALTSAGPLERRFADRVQPFLANHCLGCHGSKKPKAGLDLARYSDAAAVAGNLQQWEEVLRRLEAKEMPPEHARSQPSPAERAEVIAWLRDLRDDQARRNAGDPGPVLARRLSNAELDHTIRDLTGVDIRPAREFPVDPANEAGFDNSGESLAMSPALLQKYLKAARLVADHLVLKPEGFVFAPYPVVTETDRDRYCVHRIIAFYDRHRVDYADYFLAAWKYRHRDRLGRPGAGLAPFAAEAGLSARYLALVWSALTDAEADVGPLAAVREAWEQLPASSAAGARSGCERLRDLVVRMRRQLVGKAPRLQVKGISAGSQPLVLWNNRQLADQHRRYGGEVFADLKKLAGQVEDAALARRLAPAATNAVTEQRSRKALERFCSVFPAAFVVSDRGPYFNPKEAGKGRLLTAGFHLMQGYFRDDGPLCELVLAADQRRELDALWRELDFVTLVPVRQYKDFIFFERAEPPRFMRDAEFDFARSEDRDSTSRAKMERLAAAYLARASKQGASAEALGAIRDYFTRMSADVRRVERDHRAAEGSHLAALATFAERAYRRPLSADERRDLLAFYHRQRKQGDLGHEEALRDTVASVLLSPHFCYRFDLAGPGKGARPLSPHALASRLSYFLWASMPDAELLDRAAAGDLVRPEVLRAQARRMLRDPRVRGLATEFAANWLDIRRFEEHNSVDRGRFPAFTNELRRSMFEEPIRYFVDLAKRDRSALDLLHGHDTFVDRALAKHYGLPAFPGGRNDEWAYVADARPYGRGGLLPMAAFLTKNAPGLRTSPVKRGYWVVRRLLGEHIPPPPPGVPELPKDEAGTGDLTLPQLLARHREDKSCAGCHRRFDSVGLAFEGFGPVGERRTKDLGGRPVQVVAVFPDGNERAGLDGLREYLREKRQDDFVDNLCRKLLSYALGRSLLPSDRTTLAAMRARLAADGHAFGGLVEEIVTSPQFLNKRGRDGGLER